jgi:hypothetical protein
MLRQSGNQPKKQPTERETVVTPATEDKRGESPDQHQKLVEGRKLAALRESPMMESSDFVQSDEEQYIPIRQTSNNQFERSPGSALSRHSDFNCTNGLPMLATESSPYQSVPKRLADDQLRTSF